MRCINVINFLRGAEPRGPMDLFEPLKHQMALSLEHHLPTTWLLQFDALVSGPFVSFLKELMPETHEVGVWFEMNELHCKAADVEWRGRPGFSWDHFPNVAFTIGYSPEDRRKLADSMMNEFKRIWGHYPKSVASWNLDAMTVSHLADHYSVDAFAVCRDQIATDGFTIWGAPIAGWYPSRTNAWCPAVSTTNQIQAPVFRMLGQDPTYYYQSEYPMPDGTTHATPDTMEPVWPSGRSEAFIKSFLQMISTNPCLQFAYAQLGQENSFGWPEMSEAYPQQMKALAKLRSEGRVEVETLSETGRRFKEAFDLTPPQAQVMLRDSMANPEPGEKTIWFQNRFYRANLHIKGSRFYLRDIHVYRDGFPQPSLTEKTLLVEVEQRMLAVLDGWHWSPEPGSTEPGAAGWFKTGGHALLIAGEPEVAEVGTGLKVSLQLAGGGSLCLEFMEKEIRCRLDHRPLAPLSLSFEWDGRRSSFEGADGSLIHYKWQGFAYTVRATGRVEETERGWQITSGTGSFSFALAP